MSALLAPRIYRGKIVTLNLAGRRWLKPQRDPLLDEVAALVRTSGLTVAQIERKTGLTRQTIKRVMNGEGLQSHPTTLRFMARCCGYEIGLRPRQ